MRNQYYADSHDVAKWSVIVRLAQKRELPVQWIITLRPNNPNQLSHGNKTFNIPSAHQKVESFFKSEQQAKMKDCKRTEFLFKGLRIPLRFFDVNYPTPMGQDGYFDNAVNWLHKKRSIVLIDPDTGIAGKTKTPRHIEVSHLQKIRSVMLKGSIVAVVQWNARAYTGDRLTKFKKVFGNIIVESPILWAVV